MHVRWAWQQSQGVVESDSSGHTTQAPQKTISPSGQPTNIETLKITSQIKLTGKTLKQDMTPIIIT